MSKEKQIAITLSMPPSVNGLFAGKVRRYKSDEYKNWLAIAELEYSKIEYEHKIIGDNWLIVQLDYNFSLYTKKGAKRIKDTENYSKAVIDYLTTKIEGFQDHKIKKIISEKFDSTENTVNIFIKEM